MSPGMMCWPAIGFLLVYSENLVVFNELISKSLMGAGDVDDAVWLVVVFVKLFEPESGSTTGGEVLVLDVEVNDWMDAGADVDAE